MGDTTNKPRASTWLTPTPEHHKWLLYPVIFCLGGIVSGLAAILKPDFALPLYIMMVGFFLAAIGVAAYERLVIRWTRFASVGLLVVAWIAAVIVMLPKTSRDSAFPITFPRQSAEAYPNPVVHGVKTMHYRIAYDVTNNTGDVVYFSSCSIDLLVPRATDELKAANAAKAGYAQEKAAGGCAKETRPMENGEAGDEYVAERDMTQGLYDGLTGGKFAYYYAGEIHVRLASGRSKDFDICGFTLGTSEVYVCPIESKTSTTM